MSNPAKGQSGDGQGAHGPGREAQKAAEAQQGGQHNDRHSPVLEGGKAEAPTEGKGHAKAADTSRATSGKAEQQAAAGAGAAKEQHGRGHRKGE
jgi:hypothetical protein